MAFQHVGDPEALTQCPYDNTHMIRNKRMQYHLVDCRKNHPSRDMKVCPYNAKHLHPSAEHQFHLVHCPDRIIVDRDIIYASEDQYICVQGQQTGCVNVPPYCSADNNIEENWEDEACGESFDLVNSISFSRPRTEPLPPLLRRQPKDDPKVLKEDVPAKLKDGVMSDFEDRRKPRFTNANPDALSVCYVSGNRSLQALSSSGGGSIFDEEATSNKNGVSDAAPAVGRGQAILNSLGGEGLVGRPSSVASTNDSHQNSTQSVSAAGLQLLQPLNTTVYCQPATVTPAFVLPGVGRGAKPPNAASLPMPSFK